jgi:hypothetical protein
MNKLLIVSALFLVTNAANAEGYRLVSTDNSALSQLCITAVESPEAMSKTARSIGMKPGDITELRCNGKTLPLFLSKFRETESSPAVTYAFNKNDSTEETELCYAAVKSEQEYEQIKNTYFGDEQNIEEEVLCNGIPLKSFARKYRNRAFTASAK